jgi:pimeloyl-ACP methyl ester carboxylesterase
MNLLSQLIKWVAVPLAGLLVLAFLGLLLYRVYLRWSTRIDTPNGISSLEEIALGGLKQWIFIRGTDRSNPVLLFLHGGLGAPLLGMSSSRQQDGELIEHFTVVHWDQRGAGKSFSSDIPVDSMTFDRLVEDCNELIDYLRGRLDTQRVFLVAHSGGTITGLKTAHRYPEKIQAYVGVAQIINDYEQQRISYEFAVQEAEGSGDVGRQNALKAIGPPPYDSPEKGMAKENLVSQHGGFMYDSSIGQMLKMASAVVSFLTTPEYSLPEGIRTLRNMGFEFTFNAMWEEMKSVDFNAEIQSVRVPVYFFEGKHDMHTPAVLVERFYDTLDAPEGKKLIIFERSAHMPMIEEREKYQESLIDVVLKESHNRGGTQ